MYYFIHKVLSRGSRSLAPFQSAYEDRKGDEPYENVHSKDAMTEPTGTYLRHFS